MRILRIATILATILVLGVASSALAAPSWPDAPASFWSSDYGVTEDQVTTVADGYQDGRFGPRDPVNRGQFAKMAASGLGLPTSTPAKPTFTDIDATNTFYPYIEGAYAKGLITGYPVAGGLAFRAGERIDRQQANSILGRYLAGSELETTGAIRGSGGQTYGSLAAWYAAQGAQYLNRFLDSGQVAEVHRAATAYLVYHGVVQGSDARLTPGATLARAQAVAMVLRVKGDAGGTGDFPAPPGPDNPPTGGPLDAQAAVGVALAAVPGGAVIEVERDTHQGLAVWEVEVRTANGQGMELKISIATGDIVKREAETLPWYAQQAPPKIDIRQAMATALAATPGTIEEIELDWERNSLVWEVDIITPNGLKVEIEIDATTGQILR